MNDFVDPKFVKLCLIASSTVNRYASLVDWIFLVHFQVWGWTAEGYVCWWAKFPQRLPHWWRRRGLYQAFPHGLLSWVILILAGVHMHPERERSISKGQKKERSKTSHDQNQWGSTLMYVCNIKIILHIWYRWSDNLYEKSYCYNIPVVQKVYRISITFFICIHLNPATVCRTWLSRTPRYLELFLNRSPWLKSTPAISNFIIFWRNTGQHWSGSAVKAPPGKMYWKPRNILTCSR